MSASAKVSGVSCGAESITCGAASYNVQFIRLPKAVYLWVNASGTLPTMSSLVASVPGLAGRPPSSTTLFGGDATEDLAMRLSRRLGYMILLCFDGAESALELSDIEAELFKLLARPR
jgi:hypothetical protein